MYNPEIHHRRSIRLKGYDYSQCGAYFITICTHQMTCILGDILGGAIRLSEIGQIANDFWVNIPKHFEQVELDEFIVMPNHIHGIIVIGVNHGTANHGRGLINQTPTSGKADTDWILMKNPKLTLGKIVRYFKAKSSKIIHDARYHNFKWQRNYYEHIIRNEGSLKEIREYINNNPIQWEYDEYYI